MLAGSVAGAFGGESGYSIAIGVSFARNAITNPVTAQIADVKSLTTVTGAAQVAAAENASISATTAAAAVSVAVGGGPNGVAVGGGGAIALNVIGVDTTADITGSQLVEVGDVIVTAIDSSSINAQVLAVAASVAVGDTAGVGVALGVSVADNQIDGVSGSQGALTADIADSGVDSSGDVEVDAYSTQTIIADTLAGAVAIGGGGETGVAVAGAGVYVANLISLAITADIDGGNSADITAASVSVNAYDASEIDSIDGAAAVSASFGGEAGVSVSIGLSIAQNTIDDPVSAYIQNVASLNATSVSTSEDRTLNPGDIVQLPNGVAYEYVGTTAEAFNLDAAGTFSSSSWTQVGFVTTGPNGGGTQQLASLAPGDTVTIGAGFNTPTYTASDGVETLTPGELVSDAKGVVYAYKGASGTQSVDLSNADFTDATTWTRVASPGDVYTYIGPTNANADINSQAYYNTALWVAAAGATGKASFNTALPKNASSNSATLADGDTVELVANFSVQTGKYKVSQFEVGQSETLATGDTVQAANGDVYKYTGNGLTEDLTTEGFNSSYWTELNVVTLATGDTVEATNGLVYAYKGSAGSDDIAIETFSATNWTLLGSAGQIYTYVGSTSPPAVNLNNQSYSTDTTKSWALAPSGVTQNFAKASATYLTGAPSASLSDLVNVATGDTVQIVADFQVSQTSQTVVAGDTVEDTNGNVYAYGGGAASETVANFSASSSAWLLLGKAGDTYTYVPTSSATLDLNQQSYSTDTTNWAFVQNPTGPANYETGASVVKAGDTLEIVADFLASQTTQKVVVGDTVEATNGNVYAYAGANASETVANFSTSSSDWKLLGQAGQIYGYVGSTSPTTLDLNDQSYSSSGNWSLVQQNQSLIYGDTVTLSVGALPGEAFGQVYRYIGQAQTVDIDNANYADTSLWAPVTPGSRPSVYVLPNPSTPSGAVQVTANESATITSVSVAAALSIAAGGSAGVSVAGGGSSAVNQVAAMTTADISDVKIGSDTSAIGGGVTVAATDSSRITATEAVIAASVGIGGDAGVGVAIGISVAFNTITKDGTASGGQGKVSASVVDFEHLGRRTSERPGPLERDDRSLDHHRGGGPERRRRGGRAGERSGRRRGQHLRRCDQRRDCG